MVSVIIPCYNDEECVCDAIESVRTQTALDKVREIIVVNDGSTDGTKRAVEEYIAAHPELPVTLIDKPNGGASSARNAGLRAASGKYIALLDSDDEWLPDKLEWQLELMEKNPDIAFMGGESDDKGYIRFLFKKVDTLHRATLKELCIKLFPTTPTMVFRREILDSVGMFDESLTHAEDGEFAYRVVQKFGYYYNPRRAVVLGHGKMSYGQSGLSANLKAMYRGNVRNVKALRKQRAISLGFYLFMRAFHALKYVRRVIITMIARARSKKNNGSEN